MNITSLTPIEKDIARQWIARQYRLRDGLPADDSDAVLEHMDRLCTLEPTNALQVLVEVVRQDASDWILANLAAGPLEGLLSRHGSRVVTVIEKLAAEDTAFLRAVGGVWRNTLDDETSLKIERLQLRISPAQ